MRCLSGIGRSFNGHPFYRIKRAPHPTLSPKGARAYPFFLSPLPVGEGWVRALLVFFSLNRVIASAAKQPRGLTRTVMDVPLGCFGAMRLAMTQIFVMLLVHAKPPTLPHHIPHSPRRRGPRPLYLDRTWPSWVMLKGVRLTPSPHPLPLKGARAFPFFLSPLPVGEGRVRALFRSTSPRSRSPCATGPVRHRWPQQVRVH